MAWISVFVMAALAGIVQTVTGFGAGIILMLALPYFFDLVTAPAIASAVCMGATYTLAWKFRKHIDLKSSIVPAIAYVACSLLVIRSVQNMDIGILTVIFGVFLVVLSIYFFFFSNRVRFNATWYTGLICGAVSGVSSGLFGIGGPLMAIYYVSATKSKESYIGSIQALFCLTGSVNLLMRMSRGIYTLDLIPVTIVGMLAINLGKLMGLQIVKKLNAEHLKKIIYAVVGASGVMILVQQFL